MCNLIQQKFLGQLKRTNLRVQFSRTGQSLKEMENVLLYLTIVTTLELTDITSIDYFSALATCYMISNWTECL